jgi:hypothetical protein
MIASMEGKMQQLANQLSEQINLYKEIEAKYQHGECKIIELEGRLKCLDGEYCANEVLKNNLKSDRVKVSKQLLMNRLIDRFYVIWLNIIIIFALYSVFIVLGTYGQHIESSANIC